MTEDQRIDLIEDQIEHVIELCKTYVEGDQLEDVGNIRALYEEYAEWIDTYTEVEGAEPEYTTAWAPDFTGVQFMTTVILGSLIILWFYANKI